MFLNCLEQLLRRKIVLTALAATVLFLGLYWWGVSSASAAELDPGPGRHYEQTGMFTKADAALAAIITAGPLAATLVTALMIVIGSTLMPEEIAQGRMPMWLSLPQSRLRVYLASGLAPLVLCYLLAVVLFGGVFAITKIYFPFKPTNVFMSLVSMLAWLAVVWSSVIFLSLTVKKVASMLITFFLAAVSSLFGGLHEIMQLFPGDAPEALVTVTNTVLYIFPADRGYRGVVYGLIPSDATITENLAFFGVSARVPYLQLAYALLWSCIFILLGYLRFRRKDF